MSDQFESVALPPRLPLVISTSNRDSEFTKDARLVNCYIEVVGDEVYIYKRPGYILSSIVATEGSAGRGLKNWQGDLYSVFAGTLFRGGTSVSTALDTSNGMYRFTNTLGAAPRLVLGNGAKTYAYKVDTGLTSDLHTIDIDFPATCVKGIAYLGGATYVMDEKGQVWNSAINLVDTADSWGAANYIASQMEPDNGVFLDKQLVYIVAFNEISTEIFADVGNPTGSPLQSVQGSKLSYGCVNGDSVQNIEGKLIWLSSTEASPHAQVSMMDQLNHRIISTPAIDRLLHNAAILNVYSYHLKFNGHTFYILTLPQDNLTLVYDLTSDHWSQWTDPEGNYFPFVAAAYDENRRVILQHESDGKLYYFDSQFYQDNLEPIVVDIYTPNFDAKTMRRKQMKMMKFVCDQQPGSYLEVRYSDDDYQRWSNFRRVPLDVRAPMLPEGGTFVKRAYHFRHQARTPFRIQAVDVQYDVGTL